MNSIQFRLAVRLVLGVLAVSVLGSLTVYLVFRDSILHQFDEGLKAEAQSISVLFTLDHDGRYEFKPPQDAAKLFRHGKHADLFCIRRMDGSIAVKSQSLGKEACPGLEFPPTFHTAHKVEVEGARHHGVHVRAIFLVFTPTAERGVSRDRFQIILAAEREEVDHLLKRLWQALGFVAAIAGVVTALLVVWTVRRDMKPLRELAAQAGRIGAGDLDKRFALENVPRELDPIHRALNGLLGRIEDAWKRERRFTADVAHELRTPVAELRSMCEVAIASKDPKAVAEALADARDIGVQMEGLITALLELRRAQAAKPLAPVDAAAVARQAWQSVEAIAAKRDLSIVWQGPPALEVLCDQTMLAAVLRNLFDNAANYTAAGGVIECLVSADAVCVRNRPHGLQSDDLAHLAEPFWRKDASRSGSEHAGLGLALAEAYCRAFGGRLEIRIEDDWLTFAVRFCTP